MPTNERMLIKMLKEHPIKITALLNLKTRLQAARRDRTLPAEERSRKVRDLKSAAARCAAEIAVIERSLDYLTDEEKEVIRVFFLDPPASAFPWDVLCTRLGYERTKIYRLRKSALEKMLIALRGW